MRDNLLGVGAWCTLEQDHNGFSTFGQYIGVPVGSVIRLTSFSQVIAWKSPNQVLKPSLWR
jgi:hypothetical protein